MPQKLSVSDLSTVAGCVRRAQVAAGLASSVASYDPVQAHEQATIARVYCDTALEILDSMGADIPEIEGYSPVRSTVPLELLDTPASRRFLQTLRAAAEAGRAMDRERGWVDADERSIGWGETLAGLVEKMTTEVHGPTGRD